MIDKLCQKYEIKLAIHNHPKPTGYWHPANVLEALDGRSKWIGVSADVGHWVRSATIENVQPGIDDGSYTCIVSNAEGSEESEAALLKVECYWDIPGDINQDCVVDLLDFAILAEHWLQASNIEPELQD